MLRTSLAIEKAKRRQIEAQIIDALPSHDMSLIDLLLDDLDRIDRQIDRLTGIRVVA